MCYRLAAATGFRANELRSLTPESFDLDGVPPTCTVEAASSKRRKRDVQPLPLALVPLLRSWLEESPQRQPVFIGIAQDTARMLRADLAAARRAWIEEAKDDEPETERRKQSHFLAYRDADDRVADFHSLRVLFISRVVAGGASVREAQTLARHSTPVLTMNVYSRATLMDVAGAVDGLGGASSPPTRLPGRANQQRPRAPMEGRLIGFPEDRKLTPPLTPNTRPRRAQIGALRQPCR
jgi:integrase